MGRSLRRALKADSLDYGALLLPDLTGFIHSSSRILSRRCAFSYWFAELSGFRTFNKCQPNKPHFAQPLCWLGIGCLLCFYASRRIFRQRNNLDGRTVVTAYGFTLASCDAPGWWICGTSQKNGINRQHFASVVSSVRIRGTPDNQRGITMPDNHRQRGNKDH